MSTVCASWIWLLLGLIVILVACRQEEPATGPAQIVPTPPPTATNPPEPERYTAQVTRYNLGETTILQDHFPEDSPFRNMAVRLDGVTGAPEADGPFPVVLIMHGSRKPFSIELVDGYDQRAQVKVHDIDYPAGVHGFDDFWESESFSGHVYMPTVRIPIERFEGVDLSDIKEISLLLDQSESGALFIADLVLVQGEH